MDLPENETGSTSTRRERGDSGRETERSLNGSDVPKRDVMSFVTTVSVGEKGSEL